MTVNAEIMRDPLHGKPLSPGHIEISREHGASLGIQIMAIVAGLFSPLLVYKLLIFFIVNMMTVIASSFQPLGVLFMQRKIKIKDRICHFHGSTSFVVAFSAGDRTSFLSFFDQFCMTGDTSFMIGILRRVLVIHFRRERIFEAQVSASLWGMANSASFFF
jgi:hypothetical protein